MNGFEEQETNIRAALDLARDIFKVVQHPDFLEYDATTRHRVLINKYPSFAQAYPLVLKFLARDIKYNETAFKKLLEKLRTNPGKGVEAYIERQADYAKFLYIQDSIDNGRHWNQKMAGQIWNSEYAHMNKWMKKLKKDEDEAKNEFAEEKQKNLDVRRQELLDFINSQDHVDIEAVGPEEINESEFIDVKLDDDISENHGKNNANKNANVDSDNVDYEYQRRLNAPEPTVDMEWLVGTFAVKKDNKDKNNKANNKGKTKNNKDKKIRSKK